MFLTSRTSSSWSWTSAVPETIPAKPLMALGSFVETTMPSTPFSRVCMYSFACSVSAAHASTLVPEFLNLAMRFSRGMIVQSDESRMTPAFFPAMAIALSWSSGVLSSTIS